MPRPKKCRKVCSVPNVREFYPNNGKAEFITLTVDEYESIRLIDKLGLSQEECAEYMQVARTTVQCICNTARHKIATALTEGRGILIEGGDYRLCDGTSVNCRCKGCRKKQINREGEI